MLDKYRCSLSEVVDRHRAIQPHKTACTVAVALNAELIRARNELVRQVNQFYQEAQTTSKLIEVLEKGLLKQAEEALRIAKFSFQQGAASLLEVLDAQRVQRQILFDYAQARFELSVALARLERAVGGML